MKKYIGISLALLTLSAAYLPAAIVSWSVSLGAGVDSNGAPLPATGYTFEFGTFGGAFTPNAENFAEWGSSWVTTGIQDTTAEWTRFGDPAPEAFGSATGESTVVDGAPVGSQMFIWGYNSLDIGPASEWILITNDAWTLPTPRASTDPTTDFFESGQAGTIAILGTIDHSSANPELRTLTTQAIPEPSTYALIFGLGILGFLGYRRARK